MWPLSRRERLTPIASRPERTRHPRSSSNLAVKPTETAELFVVSGGAVVAVSAAYRGCSKPRVGWSLASVGVISDSLLSSSPLSA